MEDREVRFGLLLSKTERDALARLAETTGGLSLGAMVRNLIREEARRRGLWPTTKPTEEDGDRTEETRIR